MALLTRTSPLERFLKTIQVPQTKYRAATTAFRSICDWFGRENSTIKDTLVESFLQGSFRLGTAIRPTTDEDDYDLDIVVTLHENKSLITQELLKQKVGVEVKAYSKSHQMTSPIDARRCWTQNYADGSQFHVDILPAIPDAQVLRERLVTRNLATNFVESALGITDKNDANYRAVNPNWNNSNPKGYAEWFEERMGNVLSARKEAIALSEGRDVSDVPTYEAQTPLQGAVQLLKYHRDVIFADDGDDKPISIIITTLAAKSYMGETSLENTLERVLNDMEDHIEEEFGVSWVRNPTNALENFADKWIEYPVRKENFFKWLEVARRDFGRLKAADEGDAKQIITETFGDEVAARYAGDSRNALRLTKPTFLSPRHKQRPPWTLNDHGTVRISKATKHVRGFRPKPFSSDSTIIPKSSELKFYGWTDIPKPYEVFWQVVNTGSEAERANALRGGFDVGAVTSGKISRRESTLYTGVHSIECFIVKDGFLAARSGQFLINIQ